MARPSLRRRPDRDVSVADRLADLLAGRAAPAALLALVPRHKVVRLHVPCVSARSSALAARALTHAAGQAASSAPRSAAQAPSPEAAAGPLRHSSSLSRASQHRCRAARSGGWPSAAPIQRLPGATLVCLGLFYSARCYLTLLKISQNGPRRVGKIRHAQPAEAPRASAGRPLLRPLLRPLPPHGRRLGGTVRGRMQIANGAAGRGRRAFSSAPPLIQGRRSARKGSAPSSIAASCAVAARPPSRLLAAQ